MSDEVVFKCSYGALCGIDAVIVGWDQLYFDVIGSDKACNCFGALVVHDVDVNWNVVGL